MKKILIVDDEPEYLRLLQMRLSGIGYAAVTASNGRSALTLAKETKPALIILDINMPEMDGFEVYRMLRSDPDFSAIPIIFSSANQAYYEDYRKGEYPGALFLVKPFDNEEIFEAIAKLIS